MKEEEEMLDPMDWELNDSLLVIKTKIASRSTGRLLQVG